MMLKQLRRRLGACLSAAILGLALDVPDAAVTPAATERSIVAGLNPTANDSDFTGTGPLAIASWYGTGDWQTTAQDPGECGRFYDRCAYVYNDYPINCLSPGTALPAIQVLWIREEGFPLESTLQRKHAGKVVNQFRGAASIFAASTPGLSPTSWNDKGRDHTPRIIAQANDAGACVPAIEHVAVPRTVLMRKPLQVNAYRRPAPGLWAWLEQHGYDQSNRRYLTIIDAGSFSLRRSHYCVTDIRCSPGAESINLQRDQMLWGPYGSGLKSDVDTSPGVGNFCNSGGAWAFMTARGVGQWKRNKDSAAFVIAHELGHTLCQNHLAPSWRDSDAHIGDGSDLMGVSGRAHCPGVPDDAEQVRLDCDKDDTWGPLTLTTHETWVVQRWSTFNSAYLWGAPKPTDPGYYSVTAIGFDFCPGGPPGWCRE